MKIQKDKLVLILKGLAEVYPYYPSSEYMQGLANDVGSENEFDGHMLYLSDKGLIITDMKWDYLEGSYWFSPDKTRISCQGLDYLAEQ
ncbi:TPA: hypothetical protein ACGR8R_002157 [Enterobacter hormaechei]|uniref:hypothetical protein n=1 Tax=Enterobacter TaxID=547 RepID=UPI001018EEB2|nr:MULTISPECIES: hypothetical protein [Enterobacter cloacae complex]MCU2425573.1 hypothetical protein [Enterobacter hormaechei subsp. hoffmannii]EKS6329457.1 hypothetical protein [Enterobacter hormaechei]EKS6508815.1 hypothetical protein [Enterobacter hormaechei]EKT4031812.1 hypothetical protein [Enterobacter hormaechei]EKZ1439772.1 hypothetical protein [Enterobacter hormaechei]